MTHAVNAADSPLIPSAKILDSAAVVYGKRSVKASYNVAGNIVTVTLPDHQITTLAGNIVSGAEDAGINGTYTITVVDVDTFTYVPAAPPANPDALADVPLPGDILVGQVHVSYAYRGTTALAIALTGGATVNVQVKTAPYQTWFPIVATIVADAMVEFPVPYNFVRAVQVLPVVGTIKVFAQGIPAPGSPL
jgi:hypothetical protein